MSLEVFHVPERVNADPRADDADDERHDQGKGVEIQPVGHIDLGGEHELERKREQELDDGEDGGQDVAVL